MMIAAGRLIGFVTAAVLLCGCQSGPEAEVSPGPQEVVADADLAPKDVAELDEHKTEPVQPELERDNSERQQDDAPAVADAAASDDDEDIAGDDDIADAAERVIRPFEGIRVYPDRPAVELDGEVCLDVGWLEQIACSPGTREHESLVVLEQRPSNIHAALLMAGFEAGSPGQWMYEDDEFSLIQPTGDTVDVLVRYRDETGEEVELPIRRWIRDHLGRKSFPDNPWVFGGSLFAPNTGLLREARGEGEHYVADMTGSIIGLVTFGDEVIGFSEVLSDQAALQPPEWEAYTERLPPIGTDVTVIIVPYEEERD